MIMKCHLPSVVTFVGRCHGRNASGGHALDSCHAPLLEGAKSSGGPGITGLSPFV